MKDDLFDEYQPDDIMNVPAPKRHPKRRSAITKAKLAGTYAPIPHDRGLRLAKKVGNPMLAVLLALDRAIYDAKSNRVKLTNDLLSQYGISHQSKIRGLRRLAAAGVIIIGGHQRGEAPVVTHHWYSRHGKFKKG